MNWNLKATTPSQITTDILNLCSGIDASSQPIFVQVEPSTEARYNYCLTDVPSFVHRNGGKTIFGWIVWECPNIFLEAEFHACWLDQEGKLIDITPKPGRETKILFLPDSQRTYEHKPVDNIRMLLVDNAFTRLWLLLEKKKFELRQKHFKNDEVDADAASAEFNEWVANLEQQRLKIGRNDSCICGSGRKYKRCCGK
jgi:hypothetical protein